MKKGLMLLLLVGVSLSFCFPVFAAPKVSAENLSENVIQTPRTEKTEWRYRYYNGKWQKRLWSVTYQRWLTDWIDC